MMKIFYNPSFIVTTKAKEPLSGKAQGIIDLSFDKSIIEENGLIKEIIPNYLAEQYLTKNKIEVIDCSNLAIVPGFSDPHTHIMYSGNRMDEFYQRVKGETYLEILKKGNGILKTVRDTREKSPQEILSDSMGRIMAEIKNGVTCIEIKSGYGLDLMTETAMLQAVDELKQMNIIDVVSTFLGMHAIPPGFDSSTYTDFVIGTVLAEVKDKIDFADCFCDKGAFSSELTDRFFKECKKFDIPLRLHANEIENIGCLKLLEKYRISSVDHLLKISERDISLMKDSETIATLLPITAFSLNESSASGRMFIDNNIPVALGTDCSPLSPIPNMLFALHLSVKYSNMTCEESINAATINSAASIGKLSSSGSIEIGKKANISLFQVSQICELPYRWEENIVHSVYRNGKLVFGSK
ncbi:MAG: imidazolonepropionase [Thermoplasmataceae archaeon]